MSRGERVHRPLKRAEYEIVFITRQPEKAWRLSGHLPQLDAWDRLSTGADPGR